MSGSGMRLSAATALLLTLAASGASALGGPAQPSDQAVLAALDTRYQRAVEQNDTATMAALLADDFVLVDGDGDAHGKAELIAEAKAATNRYTLQDDVERTVRIFGDTAVITAQLRAKGREGAESVDYTLWFSAAWVRTATGWRAVFAQTSQPVEN